MRGLFSLFAFLTICLSSLEASARIDAIADRSFYTGEATGQLILTGEEEALMDSDLYADILLGGRILAEDVVPLRGRRLTVPFPLRELPMGDSQVTCLLKVAGEEIARTEAVVTRLKPKGNEVKIDRISGGLIVDELPFFPFGFYCYSPVQPTLAEEEVVRGFNMMSPYQSNDPAGLEERRRYMDRCAELGIKVHYQLLRVAGGGGVNSADSGEEEKQKEEWLRAEVEAFRDHPALLAWYISDEPTGHNMPPEALEESYQIVRQLDPHHPISIVFMAPHRAAEYAGGMDLVMTDPYPIPHGSPTAVAGAVDAITSVFEPAKPVWLVPQAFGGSEHWSREPTAQEQRVMTYLGIVRDATGVQYFIRHGLNGFPKSPIMWSACSQAALEVAALTPTLLSHEARPSVISSLKSVVAAAWRDRGMIIVIAVNVENRPQKVELTIQEVEFSGEAEVLFENRRVEVEVEKSGFLSRLFGRREQASEIEEMIDAYGVRIYRLPVGPFPEEKLAINPRNKILNPSFEENPSPSTPAGAYAGVGTGRGATYFADGRMARHGRTALRLHTPRQGEGVKLSPYSPEVMPGKTYRLSAWARALPGNGVPVLKLAIGSVEGEGEKGFPLDGKWREYALDGRIEDGIRRTGVSVWLDSPGTAFVDLLQFYDISPQVSATVVDGGFAVRVENFITDGEVRYTLDGRAPNVEDELYLEPIHFDHTATVKCAVFKEGKALASAEVVLHKHDAVGRLPELAAPYSPKYTGGGNGALVDGVFGSGYFNDGCWQGFERDDLEATIDLERTVELREVRARFLQNVRSWIWLPTRFEVYASEDGKKFREVGAVENEVPIDQEGELVEEFAIEGDRQKTRYVRVRARNIGRCPPWHGGSGGKAWIFADEIQVNLQE
jgi:hypothetical protein